MTTELDLDLGDGRVPHAYDTGPAGAVLAVFGDGHISILNHAKNALAWLAALPH